MCRVLVQALLISKSTLCPALIVVNGVSMISLLNQFPDSSVMLMVSTAPSSARAVQCATMASAKNASEARTVENDELILLMADLGS